MHHQLFYARETLPGGAITFTRLRFRSNGTSATTVLTGGIWSNVTIQMCTAGTPYTAPSTTFANNLGPDLSTVYSGNVAVASTAGGFPGIDYVDITLQNPFAFNGSGDLLIDITWAAGSWSTGTVQDTDYQFLPAVPAARLFSTTAGAATGTLNHNTALVVTLDYIADPTASSKVTYGNKCYEGTFYQYFSPARSCDLSNTAIRMQPNGLGGYDVFSIPVNFVNPIAAPFPGSDNALSPTLTLPFTFPYVGGATNQIKMCTNGFVWLDATQTSTDTSPTPQELLMLAPRLAPAWTDWNAGLFVGGGNGSWGFDIDPSNTVVYCSWNGIGAFGATPSLGGLTASTFQAKLFSDGAIEFHYLTLDDPYTVREMIVGLKPGGGTYADPGSRDLSDLASFGFSTSATSAAGLFLDMTGRPVLGSSRNFTMVNIPATASFTMTMIGFFGVPSPFDLTGVGMPGCSNNIDLGSAVFYGTVFTTPTGVLPIAFPSDPALIGGQLFCEAISGDAGANALGLLTSNGLLLTMGN